jgi:hypothetical protein
MEFDSDNQKVVNPTENTRLVNHDNEYYTTFNFLNLSSFHPIERHDALAPPMEITNYDLDVL